MKTILGISALILFSLTNVLSQSNPIPPEGSVLTYAESGMFAGSFSRQIIFSSEELFNDTVYTEIINDAGFTQGYLRSENDKWYARSIDYPEFTQTEFLLYDWSAQEGDTISVGYPKYNFANDGANVIHQVRIDSIGTYTDNLGLERKLFYYKNLTLPEFDTTTGVWLEGIGSIEHSPFNVPAGLSQLEEIFYNLVCASINGELVYENPLTNSSVIYEDCSWTLAVEEISRDITMYPNPTAAILTVELTNPTGLITISNYLGEPVKYINSTGSAFNIDVSDLASGTYFVQFSTEKDTHYQRFIKM